jgi:hypothetical protein
LRIHFLAGDLLSLLWRLPRTLVPRLAALSTKRAPVVPIPLNSTSSLSLVRSIAGRCRFPDTCSCSHWLVAYGCSARGSRRGQRQSGAHQILGIATLAWIHLRLVSASLGWSSTLCPILVPNHESDASLRKGEVVWYSRLYHNARYL